MGFPCVWLTAMAWSFDGARVLPPALALRGCTDLVALKNFRPPPQQDDPLRAGGGAGV